MAAQRIYNAYLEHSKNELAENERKNISFFDELYKEIVNEKNWNKLNFSMSTQLKEEKCNFSVTVCFNKITVRMTSFVSDKVNEKFHSFKQNLENEGFKCNSVGYYLVEICVKN